MDPDIIKEIEKDMEDLGLVHKVDDDYVKLAKDVAGVLGREVDKEGRLKEKSFTERELEERYDPPIGKALCCLRLENRSKDMEPNADQVVEFCIYGYVDDTQYRLIMHVMNNKSKLEIKKEMLGKGDGIRTLDIFGRLICIETKSLLDITKEGYKWAVADFYYSKEFRKTDKIVVHTVVTQLIEWEKAGYPIFIAEDVI